MQTQNNCQYDILVATVDPSDWTVKKVGIYSDVNDAVSRHPSEDSLGSWIEGSICDVNFDRLPEYYAIELVHSSLDKLMYIAMKGRRASEFDKALKDAVKYRKENPKRHLEELSQDTARFIDYVVDDYMARSGHNNKDVIYGAVTYLLHKLSTGSIPGEGVGNIPPFFLVPDITDKENAIASEDGQRPYMQAPGDVTGQYDILAHLVGSICNFDTGGVREISCSGLDVDTSYWSDIEETRRKLKDSWEERIREMLQESRPDGVFTIEEVMTLPIEEIIIRLMQHSYPDSVDSDTIEWAVKIDMAQDLQVCTDALYREAATRESNDPVGGFSKGTDIGTIASTYLRTYLR